MNRNIQTVNDLSEAARCQPAAEPSRYGLQRTAEIAAHRATDFGHGVAAVGLALSIARHEASLDRSQALDSGAEIEAFLREVEGRAYRIALMNVRDRGEALDIVQDAMIRLVRRYANRPSAEWPPLFYRILQNRIRDIQRRRMVRSRVLSFFGGTASEEEHDPLAEAPAPVADDPLERVKAGDAMEALEKALSTLPVRQREAFTLRNFEGLDVAQTAVAMECTEGSVKTHYSRAVHRLRELLAEHGEEHGDE